MTPGLCALDGVTLADDVLEAGEPLPDLAAECADLRGRLRRRVAAAPRQVRRGVGALAARVDQDEVRGAIAQGGGDVVGVGLDGETADEVLVGRFGGGIG
jgi:hypothetical protein